MATKKRTAETSGSGTGPARKRSSRRQKRTPAPSDLARSFAIEAARCLSDDKCTDVVVLDVRGRSQVTDFFVIGSGTSERQIGSAAEDVAELGETSGHGLFRSNLREPRSPWVALDFVDVMVHVFMPETRLYYDLEMLWGDAPRVAWARRGASANNPRPRARAASPQ